MIITDTMKTHYHDHLIQKGEKQSFIDECMGFVDIFAVVLENNPNVPDAIPVFIENINPRGLGAVKSAWGFLDDYAKFIEIG